MHFESIIIKSEYGEIKKVRELVQRIAMENNFFNEFIENIELSIGELITNIIKHGQKNIFEKKEIYVYIEYIDKVLTMYFDYVGDIPSQERIEEVSQLKEPKEISLLAESGRGIYLMLKMMDELKYERLGDKARVTIVKKIKNN